MSRRSYVADLPSRTYRIETIRIFFFYILYSFHDGINLANVITRETAAAVFSKHRNPIIYHTDSSTTKLFLFPAHVHCSRLQYHRYNNNNNNYWRETFFFFQLYKESSRV